MAVLTNAAPAHAGNNDPVAFFEFTYGIAYFFNDADAFVTQNAT
ncbi:hypothetical protein ALQ49_03373 [Pseudomonas syringae pv. apii]|uniref:Uncharacterized protein n=1 Tax=Pseudomonas syringae pv. apii TaxID=81036 RepID=A0A3M3RQI2_9PSED|nr:hypothetical protein ALQ49_03373 [Pseudomonas syringae pv. apii]